MPFAILFDINFELESIFICSVVNCVSEIL
nr:MAG TPA: hypothetical protein [Caudoviricetes sp.]